MVLPAQGPNQDMNTRIFCKLLQDTLRATTPIPLPEYSGFKDHGQLRIHGAHESAATVELEQKIVTRGRWLHEREKRGSQKRCFLFNQRVGSAPVEHFSCEFFCIIQLFFCGMAPVN